ncbi:DNA polymerase [beta proteobacterium AAP99]|nr:DNA polymerase [beta proteobacterium AAP99]
MADEPPPALPADETAAAALRALPAYAELHCVSNFSFLRGASHPQELVRRAYAQGYEALALTDECSVAGVVRAWREWQEYRAFLQRLEEDTGQRYLRPFRLIYGSEFNLGRWRLVALARDLQSWGGLCEFITRARRAAEKGHYHVDACSPWHLLIDCELLLAPNKAAHASSAGAVGPAQLVEQLRTDLTCASAWLGRMPWLAVELLHGIDDDLWLATLRDVSMHTGAALVAAGNVHMHVRSRKPLQDVMTAIRLGKRVEACGFALQPNAEQHLRARQRLAQIYPEDLLAATLQIAARCHFQLEEVRYNYPLETVPAGLSPTQALRKLVLERAVERYPHRLPFKIGRYLVKELRLIAKCQYEMFFLTVADIVREARDRGILCQGRGSAANSVVCYCLGITAADPEKSHPLLERFISIDRRNEPPDIDVDFEHERREEIIQYIYGKYGRDRAALAATVICYRTRSAIRDVGTALGVAEQLIETFASEHHWFDSELAAHRLEELGRRVDVQLGEHLAGLWIALTRSLMGMPRHLSQHVGGFVLTQTPLVRLVPVENAAMPDRCVIQWDKDDLESLGLMKVDILALGMLSAIRRCVDLVGQRRGAPFTVHDIMQEDPATYEMIRRADTVGVFQIESRAQMSMLPRLRPTQFYDLVVEVAIVRPGPISGGMVHPYLKARERLTRGLPIEYERSARESPDRPARLQAALQRTLGVPIFQEQVMQIAMIAAGFTATEADALRRAMAAWKRKGGVDKFRVRLVGGMLANGYSQEFADRIFNQIQGFGEYGFPESHAYSFALLAYQSSWLKCHEPECFLAAMLNSQPMGFYPPAQLVQDARRHDVQVLPADVSHSSWDSTLEWPADLDHESRRTKRPAVRLGLHMVGSLSEATGRRIAQCRGQATFADVQDLSLRAQLDVKDLNALAAADALHSIAGHRRQQVWEAAARVRAPALLRNAPIVEPALVLPSAQEGEEVLFDYASTGLTLRRHPLALLRPRLARMRLKSAAELAGLPHGAYAAGCGLVTVRQQPQTAGGTMFVTIEDETGPVNVIVWRRVREQQRDALLRSRLLAVHGVWQRDADSKGHVCHLVAGRLTDLTPLLGRFADLANKSRDFH